MMLKKMTSFLLALLLVLSLTISVQATTQSLPMIVDNADLLSYQEELELEALAQELRTQYRCDIVILTADSLGGKSAQDYADDYYDGNGYGYDSSGTGLLFLLAMQEREWYISTCGDAISIFTDYGIQTLGETSLSCLIGDNYIDVFRLYLEILPEYFEAHEKSTVIDGYADYSGDYYHGEQETVVYYEEKTAPNLLISLAIGLVAAAITLLIMRSSMNTKRRQHSASDYLGAGSFHLTRHQDLFLYSNFSKVRRQQNTSSGNRGGGSSVHRSSGGRSHGGGGGRF